MQTYLILENGQHYQGQTHDGYNDKVIGEVVFNTGMTGYEDTLTDPSYAGQILVFTYPLIGNYGVKVPEQLESEKIHVKAVICNIPIENNSHYESQQTFQDWLKQQKIPLITGIDTRELTKSLRKNGTMAGVISSQISDKGKRGFNGIENIQPGDTDKVQYHGAGKYKIILLDCGVKRNIIRHLLNFDVTIKQVPYNYDYTGEHYDGLLLSNGPGNPADYTASIVILKKALELGKPIFGICLGSQLLGMAAGAKIHKLKFGHRGQNHPCQDQESLKCYLTAQNHSYTISEGSIPAEWQVTFRHLHDGSIAGIKHVSKPFLAVQFHPEAAAGPNDTAFLFQEFFTQVIKGAQPV